MKLIVLQDSKKLYVLTFNIFRKFPYELKKVASNQVGSFQYSIIPVFQFNMQ